jgi:hypothetical protein
MERTFNAENEKARKQLVSLANAITDADLSKTDAGGWTLGVVFAHIAFWDQRTLVLLRGWQRHGVSTSPIDIDVVNEALTPLLTAIPPREAIKIGLTTVDTLCREIERLPDELVTAIETQGDKRRLHRHAHWQMHIEQTDKIINSQKSA